MRVFWVGLFFDDCLVFLNNKFCNCILFIEKFFMCFVDDGKK